MAAVTTNNPAPPVAQRRPVSVTVHGDTRSDDYAWLRSKDDPEVISLLEAENAHTEGVLAHLAPLREAIFGEIKSRVQETDLSVPLPKGPFEYYSRTEEGKQYPIHCRRPRGSGADGPEEVLLDQNVLAEGHEFLAVGTFEVSHDHTLLAYAFDTEGDEVYELRVRDLGTGTDLGDVIEETSAGVAWSGDGSTLFYTTLDDTMRPDRVWRHRLGSSVDDDVCTHHETDERFFCGLATSTTEEYLLLTLGSQITTEQRRLRADNPGGDWETIVPRRDGVEYALDHHLSSDGTSRWFGITNDGAENFRVTVDGVALRYASGEEVTDPGAKLDGTTLFRRHLVLHERADATERLRIVTLDDHGVAVSSRVLAHPDPVHTVWDGGNSELDSHVLRFGYMSMTTPPGIYEEDLDTGERVLLKRQPVLGDFDVQRYASERTWATADDGTRIPISVVRHVDTPLDGSAPGVLYGYGSYEISIDPTFSVSRLSLLDRGFVFAVAHVRGGGELGRPWYLNGKFLRKRNTFTDFLACARHLVDERYVAAGRLGARGGSAGGLLVGAALNLDPERFAAIVAEVPFVDCLNTMLDDSLPLTEIEKEEWGDPNDPEYYAYMKSYAPYENVASVTRPAMLVTAGLNDPRVSFWEPAKWVQLLRARSHGGGPVLLKVEMGSGHGGPSGRYDMWRDEAFILAFLVDALAGPSTAHESP